jgi:hypothetical protein
MPPWRARPGPAGICASADFLTCTLVQQLVRGVQDRVTCGLGDVLRPGHSLRVTEIIAKLMECALRGLERIATIRSI